jgi:hypothetical protein
MVMVVMPSSAVMSIDCVILYYVEGLNDRFVVLSSCTELEVLW